MESFALNFVGTMLALTVVLVLAWFALRLVRDRLQPHLRSGQTGSGDALRFVRALAVGAKERVVIVEHRGERWMLGVTAGGISTLAHWTDRRSDAGSDATPHFVAPVDGSLPGR